MNLEWKPELVEVATLKEWEDNPRKITQSEFDRLKQSIIDRGFHDVLKVDQDGTIISGHQRKQALVELGVKKVHVMRPSRPLTHVERHIIVVESNKHNGFFDFEILANRFELDELTTAGFSEEELMGGGFEMPSEEPSKKKEKEPKVCPHCGAEL